MTRTPHQTIHRRTGLLLLALFMPFSTLRAEEQSAPSPREILRDALYAEEVTRDASKAAEHYAKVLDLYEAQQPFAATALFRLAEVRRKQGNKEEATKLYQRLLREFPGAEVEGKLAREALAGLGAGEIPAPNPAAVVVDEEAQELRRVQEMVKSSPDRAKDPKLAEQAVERGQARVLEYLLESGLVTDPARLLLKAVQSGHVKIVQMLASRSKDDPDAGHALWVAVFNGYKQVAVVLLDAGINPNFLASDSMIITPEGWRFYGDGSQVTPLHLALRRDLALVRLLLDHGADPNAMAKTAATGGARSSRPNEEETEARKSIGTPLHEAARQGAAEAVKLLLAKGADPNLAAAGAGTTPLHLAAEADSPGTLDALIQAGGKLEARTAVVEPTPTGSWTPLMSAANGGALAAMEFLLKKGADPNARSASGAPVLAFAIRSGSKKQDEVIRLLLDSKADPKVRFGKLRLARDAGHGDPFYSGTESEMVTDYSLLYVAAMADNAPLSTVSLLLEAGCSAGPELTYTIHGVARKDSEGKVVKALLALPHGPVNLEELPSMSDWKEAAKTAYLDTVVYPKLAAKAGVSLMTVLGRIRPVELSPPGAVASASLAKLLLSNPQASDALFSTELNPNGPGINGPGMVPKGKIQIALVRKEPEGLWSRTLVDPDDEAAFPDLRDGDIVELSPTEAPSLSQEARTKLKWDLCKRVQFPVTLEIDGKSRGLTLRGDLLAWDPRHPNEVPWLGASHLVSLFTNYSEGDPEITVKRKGWQDIPVSIKFPISGRDIPLEAGDKMVVRWKPFADQGIEGRRKKVRIQGEGLIMAGTYENQQASTPWLNLPTLVQALADLDGRLAKYLGAPASNEILPEWLQRRTPFAVSLFPFPDFSRIQIRRLKEDGSEEVIPVNLEPMISAAGQGKLTTEEARKADIELQGGDIVEIPSRPSKPDEAWKGISEAESAFFSKALDCRIQYTDANGVTTLREIRYRAPRYLNWGSSWVPVEPVAGTPSLTAASLVSATSKIELIRGDKVSGQVEAMNVYLRDGDAVKSMASPVAPPQPQPNTQGIPAVRPPRPRGSNR